MIFTINQSNLKNQKSQYWYIVQIIEVTNNDKLAFISTQKDMNTKISLLCIKNI